MSAEGKKKRGASGVSHAKNIPFRNGGSRFNPSLAIGSTSHPRLAGKKLLHAVALEDVLRSAGLVSSPIVMSQRLMGATERNF